MAGNGTIRRAQLQTAAPVTNSAGQAARSGPSGQGEGQLGAHCPIAGQTGAKPEAHFSGSADLLL
jgi:hypothetical protein